jgi:hypothetical protein
MEYSVRKTRVALVYSLLVLLLAGNAWAEMVRDLHSATVPVENQGSTALTAASREALADVLVKVSGSSQLLRNPVIVNALKDSRNHVQQYTYVRNEAPEQGYSVLFEFDGAYVTDLVRQAGAPLWTASRPVVLAWVVVEDEEGRHFIDKDNSPEQATLLLEEFARRGVPVQLPVFDLMDMAALSTDDAWRMDAAAIQSASARYSAQDVVVGRLASLVGDKSAGDWSYFYQGSRVNRSVTVPDLQTFLRDGVNVVAGEMSARYAVVSTAGEDGELRMSVSGVTSYSEYAAIARWLNDLELVDEAIVERVQGDRVNFRLQAKADATQLEAIIGLNEHLLPAPAADVTTPLSYRWQR